MAVLSPKFQVKKVEIPLTHKKLPSFHVPLFSDTFVLYRTYRSHQAPMDSSRSLKLDVEPPLWSVQLPTVVSPTTPFPPSSSLFQQRSSFHYFPTFISLSSSIHTKPHHPTTLFSFTFQWSVKSH